MRLPLKEFFFLFLLAAIGIGVYSNTLSSGFVYDDLVTVEENLFIRDWSNLSRFFSSDYYFRAEEYSFRPLVTLTYFIDYSLWKINPVGYHLTNLLLHIISAGAAYFLARKLGAAQSAARLTSLIFLIHPVQIEAVAGISFREDLLATLFFFLSFLTYLGGGKRKETGNAEKKMIRSNSITALFFFIFALLSKEMAVSLPLIILLYELLIEKQRLRKAITLSFPFFITALIYGLGRLFLLYQQDTVPAAPEFGDPLTRIMLVFKSLGLYGRSTFFPFRLAVEYPDPLPSLTWSGLYLLSAVIFTAFLFGAWRMADNRPRLRFGIVFFFSALLPVMNLLPAARLGADRFLYLPLYGLCFWAGSLLVRRKIYLAGGILIAVLLGTGTAVQSRFWKNNLTLFRRAVEISPLSSKAHHGLGNEYFRRGINALYKYGSGPSSHYLQKAISEFKAAIAIFNREPLYHNSLGVAYGQLGEFDRALNAFQTSKRLNPTDPLVLMNLSTLYLRRGDTERALDHIKEYIARIPYDPKGYVNLGEISLARGETQKAAAAFRQGLNRDPYFIPALEGLARICELRGDRDGALRYRRKAAALDNGRRY